MGNNVVEEYGWSNGDPPPSCGYIAPQILEIVKALGGGNIVDIGAGNGSLCNQIRQCGCNVVGIEYDKQGVDVARSSFPDISFYNYGVQDDPAELVNHEGKFDIAISTEVVEHLFSPHLLPIFAGKLLKNSGHLIITTPYHGYLKNLALSVLGKWDRHHTALWHGGHIKFWSKETLTELLETNGFCVTAFYGVGRTPYLWKSMILVAQLADGSVTGVRSSDQADAYTDQG